MTGELPIAIQAEALTKRYLIYAKPQDRLKQTLMRGLKTYHREFTALSDVSFSIRRGETVGIVGRNGSGKSTLLQLICGILTPSAGTLKTHGRISALLELGAGFNPEFSGRENIYLNAAILGLSEAEVDARYDSIIAFSGITHDQIEQPVKTYSSGMYVRLAFAVAVNVEPDILVIDEALAVGDEAFQRKCFSRIRYLQEQGATVLFVSHSAQAIVQLCDRALLIDRGELLMDGAPKLVTSHYQRMIYAPADKQESLRNAIIQTAHTLTAPTVTFDPDLKSESRIEYPPRGATIHSPRITSMTGETINLLTTGERYCFCYEVHLSAPARSLRCGMYIKTKTDISLGGSASANEAETIEYAAEGTKLEVRFEFTCNLLPGAYFMNCGVSAIENDERIFLHRITDACMFRVTGGNAETESGMVYFEIEPSVNIV